MTATFQNTSHTQIDFPKTSHLLEKFGMKFSAGGPHISRTMMLAEIDALLSAVPIGSAKGEYIAAVLQRNVLDKATDSTRKESLRRLRELYALDEATPIFGLLRKLHEIDAISLPLLAVMVAWARDPLFRATSNPILNASVGDRVETGDLARALGVEFPNQYSELSINQTARHTASSWTQSGHLTGRAKKTRQLIRPTVAAVTMAFFLGEVAGYHGAAIFANPWCVLLDLKPDRAKSLGMEAHRAGLLNLRAVAEIVELSFPLLTKFEPLQS